MKLKFTVAIIIIFSLSFIGCKPKGSKAKIWLEKTVFQPNEEITVHFTMPLNYPKDAWVGIVPSDIEHGYESINDEHDLMKIHLNGRISGILKFMAPAEPESYDFRMHNKDTGGIEIFSIPFRVVKNQKPIS